MIKIIDSVYDVVCEVKFKPDQHFELIRRGWILVTETEEEMSVENFMKFLKEASL